MTLSEIMKKRASTFTNFITFSTPDGEDVDVEIQYRPATAYEIAKIYEGYDNPSVDEIFDLMTDLFNYTIKNYRWVNVPAGTANYEANEISVQDLTIDQRQKLEMLVAPGVGKSAQPEQKSTTNRSKHGKGLRKATK